MKRFLIVLLSVILGASMIAGAYVLSKASTQADKQPDNESSVEIPDEDNTNESENNNESEDENTDTSEDGSTPPSTEELPEKPVDVLTVPANEASLIEPKMTMEKGASIYMGSSSSMGNAMRFRLILDKTFLEEVQADENKKIYMLIAPLYFFDQVNVGNYTCIDWVNVFHAQEAPINFSEVTNFISLNETQSYAYLTLTNIPDDQLNTRIVAMGVLVDETGATPTYQYSAMPVNETYRTNARSLVFIASASLNAEALEEVSFTDTSRGQLEGYINMIVDTLNGLETPTDDNSKPVLTIVNGKSIVLKATETNKLEYVISPNGIDAQLRFVSSDTNIATVSADGVITGVKAGNTTIKVCVAGVITIVSVTVLNNV